MFDTNAFIFAMVFLFGVLCGIGAFLYQIRNILIGIAKTLDIMLRVWYNSNSGTDSTKEKNTSQEKEGTR